MSKLPLHIELELSDLLGKMADIVGPEYSVALIAKNSKRHNADILLGDPDLNKLILQRLPTELEVEQPPTNPGEA